jgi:ATP-dependent DNA helicase RecQ
MLDQSDAALSYKQHERLKLDALLGWCEATGCRRRPLLEYFGDTREADCGNCDGCLAPVGTWDGTEAARKALSAVYRSGQRFGAAHIVDVLVGKSTDKVEQHQHGSLSVFGIGSDLPAATWRSLLRQLIVKGYLRADADRYGALVLTKHSRAVLRGDVPVSFREETASSKANPKTRRRTEAAAPEDRELWEALRACRQRLAGEHGVPPYVIFHDRTLREMLANLPRCEADLLELSGVGRTKLERYGADFLDVIRTSAERVSP